MCMSIKAPQFCKLKIHHVLKVETPSTLTYVKVGTTSAKNKVDNVTKRANTTYTTPLEKKLATLKDN